MEVRANTAASATNYSDKVNFELTCSVCSAPASTGANVVVQGKKDCAVVDAGTDEEVNTVASSILAGAHYNHAGSTSSVACLDPVPTWRGSSASNTNGNLLYETEYQRWGTPPLHDMEAPCARCAVSGSLNPAVTLYAAPSCPPDYDEMYAGRVNALVQSMYRQESACVADGAVAAPGSNGANTDGALLYHVKVRDFATTTGLDIDKALRCRVCKPRPRRINDDGAGGGDGGEQRAAVTYTMWGKPRCEKKTGKGITTSTLYSGEAGGTHVDYRGGLSNLLCIMSRSSDAAAEAVTGDPDVEDFNATLNELNADTPSVYPARYKTAGNGANTVVQLSDRAVPCALCEVDGTTDVLTVMGTTACPPAYRREYYGWAMAGAHDTNSRQSTVCVHHEAEETPNPPEKAIGASGWPGLYPMEIEATIGGHKQNQEVVCAVCARAH